MKKQANKPAKKDEAQNPEVPVVVAMHSQLKKYRASYVRGTHTGDALAKALDGRDILDTQAIAKSVLGQELAEEKIAKYASLNAGQQRMNLGNMIRNRIKKQPELIEKVYAVVGQPEAE